LDGAIRGVDELVNSPDLKAAVAHLDDAVKGAHSAISEARATLADARKLVGDADARVDPVFDSAAAALDQARATLATVEGAVEPGADVRHQLTRSLTELAEAARAIRELADYLERNPNSIVFGRPAVSAR